MPEAADGDSHAASIAYQRDEESDSALSEMLEDLPGYVSRGLLYVIAALTIVTLTWASLNTVKIIVEVPAHVIPEGHLKAIQSPFPGTVQELKVVEGQRVTAGEVLLVYQSAAVRELQLDLRAKQAAWSLARKNLLQALPKRRAVLMQRIETEKVQLNRRRLIYKKTLEKLSQQTARLDLETVNAKGRLALLDRELNINNALMKKGVVALRRLLELRRIREEAAIEIERLRSGVAETQTNKEIETEQFNLAKNLHTAKRAALGAEIAELRRDAEQRHAMAKIEFERARDAAGLGLDGSGAAAIDRLSKGDGAVSDVAVIVALIDGTVAEINVRNPGDTFERGQAIITLVPADATLLMDIMIPESDLGRVREGQPIRFKFAAFPFAEHGVLTGHVASISPSATSNDDAGAIYRVRSRLNHNYFRTENGKVSLLPGMTATAEVETDEETLMALLLRPFTELGDPKLARE